MRHVLPPPDPGGPATDGVGSRAFAIRKVFFGDTDPDGTPDVNGWQQLGFDVDGLITTVRSTNVCQLAATAPRSTQTDGNGGIDNSWGSNVLPPALTTQGMDLTAKLNDAIAQGTSTPIIVVDKLGGAPNASPLHVSVVGGAPLGHQPGWDTTDVWPIDGSTLNGNDIATARLDFPGSYLNGRVLVAAPRSSTGVLTLGRINGIPFLLPITNLTVSVTVAADGASAMQGILSAVIPVDVYVAYWRSVYAASNPAYCQPDAGRFFDLDRLLPQTADILSDGTNEPGKPCDAISLGLGFEAEEVQLGVVVPGTPFEPCAP